MCIVTYLHTSISMTSYLLSNMVLGDVGGGGVGCVRQLQLVLVIEDLASALESHDQIDRIVPDFSKVAETGAD